MKRPFRAPLFSLFAAFSLSALLITPASAEDVDTSSHADTVVVPLSPYTMGFGGGAFAAVNGELANESEAFLKMSLVQSIQFGNHLAMGLDINWFAPGANWGGDMTVNYLMGNASFRPFIGAGAGFHYFDKKGQDFGQGLGPSGVVHVGLMLDVLDELSMRIRVPFYLIANKDQDRMVGMDVAFLLGKPPYSKRVKKLVY